MRNSYARILLCVACCNVLLAIACSAQKHASRGDDWPLQNASIGEIEIPAGASRQVQVTYPMPDGPSFPLKASVTWSIEKPVKGISIDRSGMLKVDADVPHGTTATILADVEKGRRKLSGKVYVFHPDENPLIGQWHVDTRVVCSATQEIKAAEASPLTLRGYNWSFQASQEFWVGRAHSIAARTMLAGNYKLDLKNAKIELTPTWPKKPPSIWGYLFKDGGKTLILKPLEPQDDLEAGCGYILLR
ncbi:MAG TPA: hypothetical protein VNB54_06890 [Alphaproteobacteria bacterium]|nr:hypothetical protein [Alphaproteobacteria bacterium]